MSRHTAEEYAPWASSQKPANLKLRFNPPLWVTGGHEATALRHLPPYAVTLHEVLLVSAYCWCISGRHGEAVCIVAWRWETSHTISLAIIPCQNFDGYGHGSCHWTLLLVSLVKMEIYMQDEPVEERLGHIVLRFRP